MKRFRNFVTEAACPSATQDAEINLKNRQHAIDEYGYGPLNPMEPSTEFWNNKAKMWKVSVEDAKKSICGNCAAFNVTKKMLSCIEKGMAHGETDTELDSVVEKAGLGYCEMFHFKCAGSRTCDAWLTNGPLTDKDV